MVGEFYLNIIIQRNASLMMTVLSFKCTFKHYNLDIWNMNIGILGIELQTCIPFHSCKKYDYILKVLWIIKVFLFNSFNRNELSFNYNDIEYERYVKHVHLYKSYECKFACVSIFYKTTIGDLGRSEQVIVNTDKQPY